MLYLMLIELMAVRSIMFCYTNNSRFTRGETSVFSISVVLLLIELLTLYKVNKRRVFGKGTRCIRVNSLGFVLFQKRLNLNEQFHKSGKFQPRLAVRTAKDKLGGHFTNIH